MNLEGIITIEMDGNLIKRAIPCGYCERPTIMNSGYQCRCERILCSDCGERWGWCKDHVPVCGHPELWPIDWRQKRPEPVRMVGNSQYNMSCPICGWGQSTVPDPCDRETANDFRAWDILSDEALSKSECR